MEKITISKKSKKRNFILSTIGLIVYLISYILYTIMNFKEYNIPYIFMIGLFFIILVHTYIEIIKERKENKLSEEEVEKGYRRAKNVGLISGIAAIIAFYIRLVLIFFNFSDKYTTLMLMLFIGCGALLYHVGTNNVYRTIKKIRERKSN